MKRTKILRFSGFVIAILALPFFGSIYGQDQAKSFSLKECINYVKKQSSNIKNAKIQESIAEKKVNETLGSGLPQISVAGNLVDNLELPVQLIPGEFLGGAPGSTIPLKFGTKYSLGFTGQFSQLLFDGSFFIGVEAAKKATSYYKQNTESVSESAIYNVASAYYQTLIVQKQIDLLQYNIASLKKTLEDSKLLFENGKMKEVDVDRIQVSYNNLLFQERNANESLKQAYNVLKYQMSMPIEESIVLSDNSFARNDSLSFDANKTFKSQEDKIESYENIADYRVLKTNMELLQLDKKNQISKYYPTLSAYGSYTYQSQREKFDLLTPRADWFKSYSVGIKLNIPIFTGGQTYARIQQSSLSIEKIEEDMKNARLGIDMQASNALIKYKNACDNVESETRNVNLAQKVYKITQLEYNEGTNTASDLVDSEMKYREAQTNYINSLLNLYIARLDLEKSKGNLIVYLDSISNN